MSTCKKADRTRLDEHPGSFEDRTKSRRNGEDIQRLTFGYK